MNVVAVSLFGDEVMQARYQPYLPPALRAHHNLYPGWRYRIYHDGNFEKGPYGRALKALEARGLVDMVYVDEKFMIERAMLWRLLPMWDKEVERFVIRDVDMVAPWRERKAVETWIRSGLAVHSMSDLAVHHNWPAINGMMGFVSRDVLVLLGEPCSFNALLARAGWSEEIWSSNFRATGPKDADSRYRVSPLTTNNQFFLGTFGRPRVPDMSSLLQSAFTHMMHE